MNDQLLIGILEEIRDLKATMNRRFDALEERVSRLEQRVDRIEERLDILEKDMTEVKERLDRLEKRLDILEKDMTEVKGRVTNVENKVINIEALRKRDIESINDILYSYEKGTKDMIEKEVEKRIVLLKR